MYDARAQALTLAWTNCERCRLVTRRKNVVFGRGTIPAPLLIIGEAPGADEDQQGLPFVGKAGALLERETKAIWQGSLDCYVTNLLGCRPPGNRVPMPDEVEECAPRLKGIVQLVVPKAILALGGTALIVLTGEVGITRWRGQWLPAKGNWFPDPEAPPPVIATFHPAALLPGRIRNPGELECFRTDLRAVARAVKGE